MRLLANIISISLLFFLTDSCQPTAPKITLGDEVEITREVIDSDGGTIIVDKPGDPLDDFTIEVPAEAYQMATTFEISYRPIEDHTYGNTFNPVSPLIIVKNGGNRSERIMKIRIPLSVSDDHFAMAFFYDETSGALQGIPMVSQEQDMLTVVTKHFSEIVVTSIAKSRLEGEIESEFKHGVDNWQFANYGSYIEPRGHCSGQTLTAMYYFTEKKIRERMPALYNLYDNYDNPYHTTPNIQEDDVLAYRLCSMAQNISSEVKLGNPDEEDILELLFEEISPEATLNSFAYAMLVTGMPQYVAIYRTDDKENVLGGHAMIVYKNVGAELFVSDPNYPHGPGSSDRKIIFNSDTSTFQPYSSGENAEQAANAGILYTEIVYEGGTDIFNLAPLDNLWKEFEEGTVGQGAFPAYTLTVVEQNPDGSTKEIALVNNYQTDEDKIIVKLIDADFEPQITVYTSHDSGETKGPSVTGSQPLEIELDPGVNSLGFSIKGRNTEGEEPKNYSWIGFTWVNVLREENGNQNESYSCEIHSPRGGDHLVYRDPSQEWRAKVYRNGTDVTEELDWDNTQTGFNFYYKSYYGTTYSDDPWISIFNFNPDPDGDYWGNVKNGMVGFTEGLEPVTGPERPDQWESEIKFAFVTGSEACDCFVTVIVDEKRGD